MHARAPDAQPVKCIISENPPTSGLALWKLEGSSILGTTWSCAACGLWLIEPSLGQRTKTVGMWGGEFARGRQAQGASTSLGPCGGCERSDGTSGTRSVSESLASSLD